MPQSHGGNMAVRSSKTKDLGRRGPGPAGPAGPRNGRGIIRGRVIIKCRWHRRSGGIIT